MDEHYIPNSKKYKEEHGLVEEPKEILEPNIGKVQIKKRNGFSKFISLFLPSDVKDIKNYILGDVVVPKIKDMLDSSFHAFLYKDTNQRGSNVIPFKTYSNPSYIQYNKPTAKVSSSSVSNSSIDLDDYIFNTREEAQELVNYINYIISVSGEVSLLFVYEKMGIVAPPTYGSYGWKEPIAKVSITKSMDGRYVLRLPSPTLIKRI